MVIIIFFCINFAINIIVVGVCSIVETCRICKKSRSDKKEKETFEKMVSNRKHLVEKMGKDALPNTEKWLKNKKALENCEEYYKEK